MLFSVQVYLIPVLNSKTEQHSKSVVEDDDCQVAMALNFEFKMI